MTKRPLCLWCLLFLVCVRLGLLFTGLPENPYETAEDCAAAYTGVVVWKESRTYGEVFYLKTDTGQPGLVCVTESTVLPRIGERVRVSGELSLYEAATNPGEFDTREYYLLKGYGARLRLSGWESLSAGHDWWREGLYRLRCFFAGVLDRIFPTDDAGVMKAVLLGDKSALDGEIRELYRVNGIAHILAISGLHISILGMVLYRSLRRLSVPVMPSAGFAFFFIMNYALMTGAGVSTVRALSMYLIMVLGEVLRRSYDLPTALLFSAALSALFAPYELLTEAFWLSYLAVFGVSVFSGALLEGISFEHKQVKTLAGAFAASLAVSLFTLPVVLLSNYELPLYAIFLNLLVVPLMSVVMLSGLAALVLGMVLPIAGKWAGLPAHLVLAFYELLCRGVERLPMHSVITGAPKLWQCVICWGFFGTVILLDRKRLGAFWTDASETAKILRRLLRIPELPCTAEEAARRIKASQLLCLRGVLCVLALFFLLLRLREPLRITFLDVGQGDGICIEGRYGSYMIDGGSSSKRQLYDYQLEPFLKYEGIRRIDIWWLTHPDLDHISGLMDMLQAEACVIDIGAIVLPAAKGAAEDFEELILLARQRNIDILWMSAGDVYQDGQLCFESLHPTDGYETTDVNGYSQILRLYGGGFCALFTGDATEESESYVLENGETVRADLLKAAHHGSNTSNSMTWLRAVKPEVTVISCGYHNRYGHPHEEVLERLAEIGSVVYRTDQEGALIIHVRNGGMQIEAFHHRD